MEIDQVNWSERKRWQEKEIIMRYWSRQADRLLWTRTRGQSGAWLPCREDLSGSAGYFQDTVESTAPRQHVRQYFHYDPDDRIGMGSEKSQRDYGRGKSRADLRRHSV